jgi:hypothetical protein
MVAHEVVEEDRCLALDAGVELDIVERIVSGVFDRMLRGLLP